MRVAATRYASAKEAATSENLARARLHPLRGLQCVRGFFCYNEIIMKIKDLSLAIVEAGLWLCFIYYLLYSIKNPVDLWESAVILLVTAYLAAWACPLVRNSGSWRRTFGKE